MSDLIVKFNDLEHSQAALKKIIDEFNNASDNVTADDGIWANEDVKSAMDSFASNWKDHRGDLLKKMNDAYNHSGKCLASWEKADASLAQSISAHHSTAGHGGPQKAE